MSYNLNTEIKNFIISLAEKYKVQKVILYGSRARGTNRPRSDIDIAVLGGDFLNFALDVEEYAPTLLFFDVVNLAEISNENFLNEIDKDGVTIYEEV